MGLPFTEMGIWGGAAWGVQESKFDMYIENAGWIGHPSGGVRKAAGHMNYQLGLDLRGRELRGV